MAKDKLVKIGEIAQLSNLPVSTVTYYNRLDMLKEVCRTPGRVRLFNKGEVLKNIQKIKDMRRDKNLMEIKKILEREDKR